VIEFCGPQWALNGPRATVIGLSHWCTASLAPQENAQAPLTFPGGCPCLRPCAAPRERRGVAKLLTGQPPGTKPLPRRHDAMSPRQTQTAAMVSFGPFPIHQDTEEAPWWSSLLVAAAASAAIALARQLSARGVCDLFAPSGALVEQGLETAVDHALAIERHVHVFHPRVFVHPLVRGVAHCLGRVFDP
jgi:hypothetical protein